MSGTIRQLEERQLATEVTIMRWSPKMDLLAVANKKGEVSLHRLTWQRVWLVNPPEEFEVISNLSWHPDGKLLAVSYDNTKILHLIDIENKNIIHKQEYKPNNHITCMSWLSLSTQDLGNDNFSQLNLQNDNKSVLSPTGPYLPPLPTLNHTFTHEPGRKEFTAKNLDILFLGHESGEISMYVFGMFYCGKLKISDGMITEITGGCGNPIWISCKFDDNTIKVYRLSCPLLERSKAFLKLAQMQAQIDYLMDYLSQTLMAISEAWETILLEMDEKLTRYEDNEPPGTLAADFLELLMIGISSSKLASFLLHDLSDKGLKKLAHSIEICYSNIQKLVLKHLNSVGMALAYQLGEMQGMARFGGDYEALGLENDKQITTALHAVETFLAKSSEIQQVIDQSMKEYKAFFRWLYVEIAKLTDEKIPSEASKISQQELTFIAEFLLNFDTSKNNKINDTTNPSTSTSSHMDMTNISSCSSSNSNSNNNNNDIDNNNSSTRRKGVNLEKLGQYLRREPLKIPLSVEGSEWGSMLQENKCLLEHPLIIKQDLNMSLLQAHDLVVETIGKVFLDAYKGLVNHFKIDSIDLTTGKFTNDNNCDHNLSSQIVDDNGELFFATTDSDGKILRIFKIEVYECDDDDDDDGDDGDGDNVEMVFKSTIIDFNNRRESFSKTAMDLKIIDLQFYSINYLSLLVFNKNNSTTCLIQLPIKEDKLFSDNEDNCLSISDFIGNNLPKSFSGITAGKIVVSGQRKVAAILSENNRKIRLLETEVEPDDDDDEEDEDDDDSSNLTKSINDSRQDISMDMSNINESLS
ncbi:anaphase-promoting complex subunit 4 [Microplitis mediator]|uniref:anaphase-promoting complex subunit 4 n=1 Tax=Microplitis mediator TaxID=375433 RepID=UPI002555E55E|nr:anaphase-promoting complex subunit 4 [Microplitis mediator]